MNKFSNDSSPIQLIENAELKYDGCNFDLLTSEKLFLESLATNIESKTININPYGFTRVILTSIFYQLNGMQSVINRLNEEGIQRLEVGQKVKLDGSIGIIEEIQEDHKVKVKFSEKLTYILPERSTWRINPYYGTKKVTNYKHKPNKYIKKEIKTFKDIFELDSVEIPVINNYKTLIVCNKKDLKHFERITMKDTSLVNLISSGYYTNSNNYERRGRDPLQRDPLFCFVPNLEIASELIKSDKHIKNIIVYGKDKIKGNSIYFDLINNNKRIDTVTILMDIIDLDYEIASILDKFNYDIIQETPPLINNGELPLNSFTHKSNNLLFERNIIAERFTAYNKTITHVESEVDELSYSLKRKILNLRNEFIDNKYIMNIVIKTLGFLGIIRTLPIPLKELENIRPDFRYKQIIRELENEKLNILATTSNETFYNFNEIINDVKALYNFHESNHPKEDIFKDILITLTVNDCIVVNKKYYIDYLEPWINQEFHNSKANLKTLNQVLKDKIYYDNIYFMGWYEPNVFFTEAKTIGKYGHHILYHSEQQSYNFHLNKYNNLTNRYILKNTPDTNNNVDEIEVEENTHEDLNFILNNMEVALKNSYQATDIKNAEDATLVLFDDSQFSFLTNGYTCHVLDREKETVNKKNVSELEVSDEIVFVDNDKDVFKELVYKMRNSSNEKNELYKLSKLWIESLKNFQNKHGFSEVSLAKLFKKHGVSRHPVTITNWLNDPSVIGADEVIEATAKITNDKNLRQKLTEVKNACSTIRALHIKLGRYLAGSIINSYNADQDTDKILQSSINEISKSINIVTVLKKNPQKVSVPYYRTNKLLVQD